MVGAKDAPAACPVVPERHRVGMPVVVVSSNSSFSKESAQLVYDSVRRAGVHEDDLAVIANESSITLGDVEKAELEIGRLGGPGSDKDRGERPIRQTPS